MDTTNTTNPEDIAVGCFLSIKTTSGDEFEAQVVSFDRPSNILILQEGLKTGHKRDIRLLKANYIREFVFLGQGGDPLDPGKCYIDLQSLQAKEELALRLPVRWDKTGIVVMNEVHVNSPYKSENVVGGTAAANERVRKVVEFERKRLQARSVN